LAQGSSYTSGLPWLDINLSNSVDVISQPQASLLLAMMAAMMATAAPVAKNNAQVTRSYWRIGKKIFAATCLTAIILASVKPSAKPSKTLMRSEPHADAVLQTMPPTVPANSASWELEADPVDVEKITPVRARPIAKAMRMILAEEVQSPQAPAETAQSPRRGKSAIRREPRRAKVASQKAARPAAWGTHMRKEARRPAALDSETFQLLAAYQARGLARSGQANGSAKSMYVTFQSIAGVMVAVAMLVGFANQVKSTVTGLMQASGLEDVKGKGK